MKREGYVIIDHTNSPGLPAEIAIRNGLDPKYTGAGKKYEAATQTCNHCKGVVLINKLRTRPRAHCPKCNGYICDGCAYETTLPLYVHTPFEKKIDIALAGQANLLEFLPGPK
jgi:hypothetical protein